MDRIFLIKLNPINYHIARWQELKQLLYFNNDASLLDYGL